MATYPAAPTGLAGSLVGGNAHLAWDAETGAAYYIVERSLNTAGPWTAIGRPTTNSFDDTDDATHGTTQKYRVAGAVSLPKTSGGRPVEQPGAYATPVSVTIPADPAPTPPAVPGAPADLAIRADGGALQLTWGRVATAQTYSVYRGPTNTGTWTKVSDQQKGLGFGETPPGTSGDPVWYHVTATNPGGEGTASAAIGALVP